MILRWVLCLTMRAYFVLSCSLLLLVPETLEIKANDIQLHDMSFEYLVLYWSPRTH